MIGLEKDVEITVAWLEAHRPAVFVVAITMLSVVVQYASSARLWW